ncbi:poly-beta-1,6-N-acetyl-D-glucosamine N-deacetylase PgaB [Acinetobacter qingfengensis]|uniref:Poly-beta-1,6-N-acetyl-D-glucosamine N-deacetylase PgaB n=1 Tax=Acinetobacter qingfengensis TaxID=1262585 RepID=A0A1E7RE58_9GAMM|nr:poly-beta-1,6-N-acetyl-D-glucosamine N-deacetylase PgaB [Acinetobacter qingfengensis]KAA8734362.1 poly-beta-1,6-N-acetyl-D-glucosamine N-deacetylase PgaB [Acinetobacter qingfengensis]OEY97628.1 poly-beta-1,6-N-acetyl-D-glucosamine N-deacetylase PgaB [Acinetobacter qingfengensis]
MYNNILKKAMSCILGITGYFMTVSCMAENFNEDLQYNQSIALNFHDVRDDVAKRGDRDVYAIHSKNLAQFFDWLSTSKWQPVTLKQIKAAREGIQPLPANAILLTFDDGMLSSYSKVFPLLKTYKIPAVFAIVTGWTEGTNQGGIEAYGAGNLMTWPQMQEMQRSGLVEFASHSHNLHQGILANPQGNQQPAAITRQYFADKKRYETDQEFQQRIYQDLTTSKRILDEKLGIHIDTMIWPYGAVTTEVEKIAHQAGLTFSFSLGNSGVNTVTDGTLKRMLMVDNPTEESIQEELLSLTHYHDELKIEPRHSLNLNLDGLVSSSVVQSDQQLGKVLDKVQALGVDRLIVNVFNSDQQHPKTYFPNQIFPMQEDLLNRFLWQSKTRLFTRVYANIPFNKFHTHPDQLVPFITDLMKSNHSISGIQLDIKNDLQQMIFGGEKTNLMQQRLKLIEQAQQQASIYTNISETMLPIKIILNGEVDIKKITNFQQLLLKILDHVSMVSFEINQPQDKHNLKDWQKKLDALTPMIKERILININVTSLKTSKDWKNTQEFLYTIQRAGIQNISLSGYQENNAKYVHQYLYSPMSKNISPLNYRDPFMQYKNQGVR